MLPVVAEDGARREDVSLLDDVVREGARRMLTAALEAEVDAYLADLAGERDDRGRRLVVRNGHAQSREVMTAAGAVEVGAPRVNDKGIDGESGQRKRFRSAILPPWCRKSPKVAEVLLLPWFHKASNVLSALPKSAHPGAKAALAEIYNAEDKRHAQAAAKAFTATYGAKFPKATTKITDDLDVLLSCYDYPAEHWIHLRITNPIESTFATVRHRTRVTKGPGSRTAGLAMAFKLIESAQQRWRAVNAPHLVALVRAGAVFVNGQLVERPAHAA